MICIFAVIWYLLYSFKSIKQFFFRGIAFAFYSFLAAGMAAILLIPAYMGIKQTASGETMQLPEHSFLTSVADLLNRQFALWSPISHDNFDGNANLYIGIFSVLAVGLYVLNGEIKVSEKIKKVLLIGLFYLSFSEMILNFIWHGFHDQYGIPNRFSFLLGFVLLYMLWEVFEHLEGVKGWHAAFACMAGVALMAYAKLKGTQVLEDNVYGVAGMSADFKDKIFDAFTRAENSLTNKIQGTGLGMAITRNLVEAMGGTIDVESEPGQGSCFEVLMDLKIAEERSVSLASQVEKEEPDVNILKGMRFLCAEDNKLNAEILMELLKIEDAECTICENGEKVLETFEQSAPGDYDMILMDVQMPVMNGYEATKAIRRSSHELAKTIPIIAMTANAFSEDIQHSLAAGMTAHISKPVEMKVLKKTIRNIKSGEGASKRR